MQSPALSINFRQIVQSLKKISWHVFVLNFCLQLIHLMQAKGYESYSCFKNKVALSVKENTSAEETKVKSIIFGFKQRQCCYKALYCQSLCS